jgi:hypothetical protein
MERSLLPPVNECETDALHASIKLSVGVSISIIVACCQTSFQIAIEEVQQRKLQDQIANRRPWVALLAGTNESSRHVHAGRAANMADNLSTIERLA